MRLLNFVVNSLMNYQGFRYYNPSVKLIPTMIYAGTKKGMSLLIIYLLGQ